MSWSMTSPVRCGELCAWEFMFDNRMREDASLLCIGATQKLQASWARCLDPVTFPIENRFRIMILLTSIYSFPFVIWSSLA